MCYFPRVAIRLAPLAAAHAHELCSFDPSVALYWSVLLPHSGPFSISCSSSFARAQDTRVWVNISDPDGDGPPGTPTLYSFSLDVVRADQCGAPPVFPCLCHLFEVLGFMPCPVIYCRFVGSTAASLLVASCRLLLSFFLPALGPRASLLTCALLRCLVCAGVGRVDFAQQRGAGADSHLGLQGQASSADSDVSLSGVLSSLVWRRVACGLSLLGVVALLI